MRTIFAPFRFLFRLWFGCFFYLSLLLLYPAFWITTRKEKWYPACFKLKLFWARLLQASVLIWMKRDYKAPLPKESYVIASNHASYLDIVFMYRVFTDKFIFLGKGELLKWPLFNIFFKTMDIAVDRSSRIRAARSLVRARQYMDKGYNIAIFPEGTIPDNVPVMIPFKDGAFQLAIEKQAPIVPMTFLNNWQLFADPSQPFGYGRPGISRVIIHEPIPTKGLSLEDLVPLREQVFKVIEDALIAHNKEAYERHEQGS